MKHAYLYQTRFCNFHQYLRHFVLMVSCVAAISGDGAAQSQLSSGDAFLQGQYVEIGLNHCGSFGTTIAAPSGFHARSGVNATAGNATDLGFVADVAKDGWTTGTASHGTYDGDYFMPGNPYIGWSITAGSINYSNDRTYSTSSACKDISSLSNSMPGSITSVSTVGTKTQATWVGSGSNLQVKKEVMLSTDKLYFTVRISIKNTGGSSISGIHYTEYVNPDNDAYQMDVTTTLASRLETTNSIVYQYAANGKSLVSATGVASNGSLYMGLGSNDCRAKVFRGIGSNFSPNYTRADSTYNTTNGQTFTGTGSASNDFIGIGFNIGTIPAGDSTTMLLTYILNGADFSQALTETDPGYTVDGTQYYSGDTAYTCSTSPVIKLTDADYYTWSWSPSTGLNTTTGTTVTATLGSTPIRYIATGTAASCGNKYDTVTLSPLGTRLYVDSGGGIVGHRDKLGIAAKDGRLSPAPCQ